jgi:hypothetical protein
MIRSTAQGLIERNPTSNVDNVTRLQQIPSSKRYKCRTRDCAHRVYTQGGRCSTCVKANRRTGKLER